jgi:O-acetyl-ADP-ribose deacetylase (regulator of RNase III)
MNKNEFKINRTQISLIQGDITNMEIDAIVNAANSSLMGGGGVDGAIHRRGGPTILEECINIRKTEWPEGLPTGHAVITSGGNLRAKFVIHTVGPIWRGGKDGEAELLANAYRNSLRLAHEKELRTIAFPSISTGAYGYPIYEASRIALQTVKDFVAEENDIDKIVFVLFSEHDLKVYKDTMKKLQEIHGDTKP